MSIHQNHNHFPIITVLMPAYNCAPYVKQAIDSILNQTYPHLEIMVADDGSTDETRSVIDEIKDPRIKRFHSNTNQGLVARYNDLMKNSTGDYLTFLASDDWSSPDRLELQLNLFQKNPQLAIALGTVAKCDNAGNILQVNNSLPRDNKSIRDFMKKKESVPSGGLAVMMVKRASYEKHGGFESEYHGIGSDDIAWFLRMSLDGEIESVPKILYYYRYNPNSSSRSFSLNPLKYNSHRLAFFLHYQREKNNGLDDLTGLNSGQYQKFKSTIIENYQKNPNLLYTHIIKSKNLDPKIRLDYCLKAIKENPRSFKIYRYFLRTFKDYLFKKTDLT